MYDYLTPECEHSESGPPGWTANAIPANAFPGARVFCLVGTNPADYDIALLLRSAGVGVPRLGHFRRRSRGTAVDDRRRHHACGARVRFSERR